MKKIICCLLVAVMLSACSGTKNSDTKQETNQENAPRKEGEKRVGDIIMVNGELGVVFAVTTDGQHGKVMSASQTECAWDDAKKWCAYLGYGWKFPTIDELRVIRRNKAVINSALKTNGYTLLGEGYYWSSEISNEFCAWGVNLYDGYTVDLTKRNSYYVRAVTAF